MDNFAIYNVAKYEENFIPDKNIEEENLLQYLEFEEKYQIQEIDNPLTYEEKEGQSGERCGYFAAPSSGSRLIISNTDLNFETNDFTIEFWAYYGEQTSQYTSFVLDEGNTNLNFLIKCDQAGKNIALSVGSSYIRVINTGVSYQETMNQWVHYALVRKDGIFYIYQNGTKIGEGTGYENLNIDLSNLAIGGSKDNNGAYKGYMDNFAIYNIAKYEENFIPDKNIEEENLLQYLDFEESEEKEENTLRNEISGNEYEIIGLIYTDEKTKLFGERSVYFTATSADSRLITTNTNLNFGTNDFTIEFWAYYGEQTSQYTEFILDENNSNLNFMIKDYQSGNNIGLSVGSSWARVINTGVSYQETRNQWVHYALVRKDGIFYIYQNGTKIGEGTGYEDMNIDLSNLAIGGSKDSNGAYKGYMDNFAIYNGAKYTEDFTPTEY